MKVLNQGISQINKRNVYIDVDDVILLSSWCIIDILNEYRVTERKNPITREEGYHSLHFEAWTKDLYGNWPTVEQLFGDKQYAPIFFSRVKFNEELINGLKANNEKIFKAFNWIMVTKGNDLNCRLKYELLFESENRGADFWRQHKKEIGYYALEMDESKNKVHMINGIQIDDMHENIRDTDAELKILLKNEVETGFNTGIKDNLDNLYIVDNTKQLIDTLDFIAEIGDDFFMDLNFNYN